MRGTRIVIPKCLQHETLERIHEGHQGINKCRARANRSVWWPWNQRTNNNFGRELSTMQRASTPTSRTVNANIFDLI